MRLPRRGLRFVAVVRPGGFAGPSMRLLAPGYHLTGDWRSESTGGSLPAALLDAVAGLAPSVGDVLIGSELKGLFRVPRPHRDRFEAVRVETTLRGKYDFEGAAYVAG